MITGIMRCVAFFHADPMKDSLWDGAVYMQWTVIEPGCYLIAACLPCLRPLLNYVSNGKFDPQHYNRRAGLSMEGFKKVLTKRSWPTMDRSQASGQGMVTSVERTVDISVQAELPEAKQQYDEEHLVEGRP